MPLDAVHNGGITTEHSEQVPSRLLPHENVPVVTPRCDAVPVGPEEVGLLDVRVDVAVATVAPYVVVC